MAKPLPYYLFLRPKIGPAMGKVNLQPAKWVGGRALAGFSFALMELAEGFGIPPPGIEHLTQGSDMVSSIFTSLGRVIRCRSFTSLRGGLA